MTTFTNIPSTDLEPGDPIRSVDIIAIKDNTIFTYEGLSYEILDTQTFESSETWTKPTTGIDPATDSAILILVGGGGSGGAARTGNDAADQYGVATGGGCAIAISSVPISFLSSTETVTIGAGGAAVSQTGFSGATEGNAGGTTSIGSITKPGGGGGRARVSSTVGTTLGGGSGVNTINNSQRVFGLSIAGRGGSSDTITTTQPEYSGGGSNGNNFSTQRTQNRTAGPAKVFSFVTLGAGGDGAQTTGGTGANPGGGGGGASNRNGNTTGGAGGIGWARVYVVRGSPEPADFYERKLA